MSIFSLKTSEAELSSVNQGSSRLQYEEVPSSRDITGNNFSNGNISFKFENSGQKWFMPSKSYIRARFRLSKAGVGGVFAPLVIADNIAPNMDFMPNLFQKCEFRVNSKTISVIDDFVPQVDALETRLTKSKSWLDSFGEATNWWQSDQKLRQVEVSADGTVIKDKVPGGGVEVEQTRVQMGFDVGGAVASNVANYNAETGVILFQPHGGAGIPDCLLVFKVGDYFAYRGTVNDGFNNVRMRVLELIDNTRIRVSSNLIANSDGFNAGDNMAYDFYKIITPASAVGDESRRLEYFETCWQPPLSVFKIQHAMPCGAYELLLNPQTATAWKQRAIESALGSLSKVAGTDYDITLDSMLLYIQTIEGPRVDDLTYLLDLEQTRCQTDKIDTSSFAQKITTISPATYAITIAYQDSRAGIHTGISSSKFKSYGVGDPTLVNKNQELRLNRQYINYAGQNLPSSDGAPEFLALKDYTTQLYLESQIYSGAFFDTGGGETIEEFHERGSYYYFSVPRDGTDTNNRLSVHTGFTTGTDVVNMRVLMFDHSKQVAKIRIMGGRVVDCQLNDA